MVLFQCPLYLHYNGNCLNMMAQINILAFHILVSDYLVARITPSYIESSNVFVDYSTNCGFIQVSVY